MDGATLAAVIVTALATGVLAWFTRSLVSVTRELVLVGRQQRRDLTAPRLVVYLRFQDGTGDFEVWVRNVGAGTATNVIVDLTFVDETGAMTRDRRKELPSLPDLEGSSETLLASVPAAYLPPANTAATITFDDVDGPVQPVLVPSVPVVNRRDPDAQNPLFMNVEL